MGAIPKNLIPLVRKKGLRTKYENNLELWKHFASRIQKHPLVKNFIVNRDKVCQACGAAFHDEKATPFHVHHTDYDHACSFGKTTTLFDKARIRHLPDCTSCQIDRPDAFEGCMERLVAVHPICNMKIEKLAEHFYEQPKINAARVINAAQDPVIKQMPRINNGAILKWCETIKSSTERTGLRKRRRVIAGMQEVVGSVEIIKGDFLIVKVVESKVVEQVVDTRFRLYRAGDIVRMKASTFFRRQGTILESHDR